MSHGACPFSYLNTAHRTLRWPAFRCMSMVLTTRAACFGIVVASAVLGRTTRACEALPDLHIKVTDAFDGTVVRNDYSLNEISALARQQHRDNNRALLGFYASEFDYTIDLVKYGDQACPAHVSTVVTLRLQHRVIEIGREAAANACVYPVALQHYRRLAEVDEQTVEQFSARVAAMLSQASPALQQIRSHDGKDLDAASREQIRAIVDAAIVPLHNARQDAQQAVNNPDELRQLAHACSI